MRKLREAILLLLRTGPKTSGELATLVDRNVSTVKVEVWKMCADGLLLRTGKNGRRVFYGRSAEGVRQTPAG